MTNDTEVLCIFCGKDMSELKFRIDYILIPWIDDPDDSESFNKIAKCSHLGCYNRFVELNVEELKNKILEIAKKP